MKNLKYLLEIERNYARKWPNMLTCQLLEWNLHLKFPKMVFLTLSQRELLTLGPWAVSN